MAIQRIPFKIHGEDKGRKKMEVKYYVCNHCGNIIEMVKDKGVPVADFCLCDGEQVEEVYAYCNLHGLWKC